MTVLVGHLIAGRDIADRIAAYEAVPAMPARMVVAYVRTLEVEAPRPVATPSPPAPSPSVRRSTSRSVAAAVPAAASAPSPVASEPDMPAVAATLPAASDAPDVVAAQSTPTPSSSSPAASAASAPSADTFVWPSATRVSYVLTGYWRGELNGGAEVEWIRRGERYQVRVDIFAGPRISPIFSRQMTSEGRLGADGLVPERYDEETQVLFRERRRVGVAFEGDAVVLANGQRRERLAGVQDTASQFIQFTWLFGTDPGRLRVGNSFELPLALPRSMNRWTYDVAEEETLLSPFGPLTTFHLKPRRDARRPGEWLVEMWFAPELRHLPVRIRIEQEAGSFIDLMIDRKPELTAS
ncbi:MAG: DUF3108 domain-containing protein [Caldimonas sp.]